MRNSSRLKLDIKNYEKILSGKIKGIIWLLIRYTNLVKLIKNNIWLLTISPIG